jgi:hypothetical protein
MYSRGGNKAACEQEMVLGIEKVGPLVFRPTDYYSIFPFINVWTVSKFKELRQSTNKQCLFHF